MTKTG